MKDINIAYGINRLRENLWNNIRIKICYNNFQYRTDIHRTDIWENLRKNIGENIYKNIGTNIVNTLNGLNGKYNK